MSRRKAVTARNARELADVLELSDSDRAALEVQLELTEKIAFEVRRLDITHAKLARLAGTSRPRVTAILNGNLEGVSTDLLLRLLAALNVRVELRFRRAA
jgi:predicted XRE-type DNA-binding protein